MPSDFTSLRQQILQGHTTAQQAVEQAIAAAQSPACQHAITQLDAAGARQTAATTAPHLPLAGITASIKELFDVQGWCTRAGSTALAAAPSALHDATAVARLRAAGAALLGQSHMVEFAFSGVGTNPHYATPHAYDGLYAQPITPARVPGGSSSGAGVSVASGAAWIGLGSDTGGSIRIPAALNGVVGFKPTAHLVPLDGTVPLSPSLDTACAITRSVRDAITAHEVLAARTVPLHATPLTGWRLAVPRDLMLDQTDPTVAHAFARTLQALRDAGARITEIDLPELQELARINAAGGLTAAESHAWHRPLLARHAAQYDPRVLPRILRGAALSAADYTDLQQQRADWITRVTVRIAGFDALLSPTAPIVAPLLDDVAPATGADAALDAQRDQQFLKANALLLRNTSVVNMLDGCALSLPCHMRNELPVGLMVWHAAHHDDAVLNLSLRIEETLQAQRQN